MYKFAIIDDNDFDQKRTIEAINNYCNEKSVIYSYDLYKSTLNFDFNKSYEAIFLDIDMPDENGIDFAKRLNQQYKTNIIFITNHSNYMYSTFDVQPFHFINKKNIEKTSLYVLELLFNKLEEENKKIKVKSIRGELYISINDIYYIDLDGHQCRIHTKDNQYYTWSTLKSLSEEYKIYSFILINQSTLINLKYVNSFSYDQVTLQNNKTFPISTRLKSTFKKTYEKYIMRSL